MALGATGGAGLHLASMQPQRPGWLLLWILGSGIRERGEKEWRETQVAGLCECENKNWWNLPGVHSGWAGSGFFSGKNLRLTLQSRSLRIAGAPTVQVIWAVCALPSFPKLSPCVTASLTSGWGAQTALCCGAPRGQEAVAHPVFLSEGSSS